ncbi:MAG: phage baseplate protein [Beduini sp.]|uniref:phage baseplate protein n=1 Tax=Beduini sp. TaxID=1922300 RepID=UPI0039907C9A
MRSICNIDYVNPSNIGASTCASDRNEIIVSIQPLINQKDNLRIELSKSNGTIIQATNAIKDNADLIWFTLPAGSYTSAGTIRLRLLSDQGNSSYVIFNTSQALSNGDTVYVGINALNNGFEIMKYTDYHTPQVIDNLISTSAIDALSANQGRVLNNTKVAKTDGTEVEFTTDGAYLGFSKASGNYLRTPSSGLLPNVSGGNGNIGTSGWPFNYGYFKNLYLNGVLLLNVFFPVGSIKLTYTNSNPGTSMGGTWVLLGQNRYIVGAGSSYSGGATGGSSTTGGTALTVAQMPSHGHKMSMATMNKIDNRYGFSNYNVGYADRAVAVWDTSSISSQNSGGGGTHAHSFTPNYIALYIWRRTA